LGLIGMSAQAAGFTDLQLNSLASKPFLLFAFWF
jgi:hypothetical protein